MLGYPPGVGLETPRMGLEIPGCGPGDPLGVGLDIPLGVGLETPWVWAWRPLGVGLETPPGQTPQLPPWVWAWKPARHAGIAPPGDLQGMLGYHLQFMLGCVLPVAVAICWGGVCLSAC